MTYLSAREAATYHIRTAADLDDLASGGVITVAANTQLIFENTGSIVTSNRFNVTAGTLYLDSTGGPREVTFVSASTLFTVSGSAGLDANEVNVTNNGTGTIFDGTTTGQIEIDNCNFTNFLSLGSVVGAFVFIVRNFQFIIWTNGLIIDVENLGLLAGGSFSISAPSTPLVRYSSKANTPFANMDTLTNIGPADFIEVSPSLPAQSSISISSGRYDANLFVTSGGSSGSFTAVADAAIGSTSITSVTDNGGVARFNFTGPTVYVDQEVVVSGYVTNTAYNQTAIITATDGTTYFEARVEFDPIAFGSDESGGTFTSASVTITATAHGLSNAGTLTLDGTENTDYDGGATIYNALTNSFQVNRAFTVTRAGTWDTAGLDQSDPRVIASNNPGFETSHYIAAAYVNNNTTANGSITNNVFSDIAFGTGGGGLVAGSTMERWKLIDPILGEFEYTGNEPFSGYITFDFTALSSGGTTDFRYKWVIDTGGGYGDLPDNVEALSAIGNDSISTTKTFPLNCSKGDRIKPQITRNSGSSVHTTQYATMYISQE